VSTKVQIFSHLWRTDLPDRPVNFAEILTSAAEVVLKKSRIDAEVFAAANTGRYWADVLDQVEADRKLGLVPFCEIVKRQDRLLTNACVPFVNAHQSKLRMIGLLLRARPALLTAIDVLTDREYEALGCLVSRLLGAQRDYLTPPGDEGGIDFLATVQFYSASHLFSGIGKEIRIVGQSKKYMSKVPVSAVDQFIQTVQNVRYRSARVDRVIPPWFHASSGPIVGWMVAHSGFQTGAQDEAKKHGIILADSRDLAEIVALCRKFYCTERVLHRVTQLTLGVRKVLEEFPN
jgi:hypothetical protein